MLFSFYFFELVVIIKIYRGKLFTEPGLTPIVIFTKYGIIKYYVFFDKEFEVYRKKLFEDVTLVGYTDLSGWNSRDKLLLEIKGRNFHVYNKSKYCPFAYLSVGKGRYVAIESKSKIPRYTRIFFSHK